MGETWIAITGAPPPADGVGAATTAYIALNVLGYLIWAVWLGTL